MACFNKNYYNAMSIFVYLELRRVIQFRIGDNNHHVLGDFLNTPDVGVRTKQNMLQLSLFLVYFLFKILNQYTERHDERAGVRENLTDMRRLIKWGSYDIFGKRILFLYQQQQV